MILSLIFCYIFEKQRLFGFTNRRCFVLSLYFVAFTGILYLEILYRSRGDSLEAPIYRLEGVVKAKEDSPADFVGPLDLILHLLSKNKMEIKDIQISLILTQYLEWMDRRKEMDLEVASEFVSMASHLVYIKTRMLLSIHDEEAISEMEQLIATLEAHQRNENYLKVKAVVPQLQERFQRGRDLVCKQPEPLRQDRTYRYVHKKEDLLQAMSAILSRGDKKLPPPVAAFQGIVGREVYPVAEKAGEILRRLMRCGVAGFQTLFFNNRTRSEVVATFLAVLELCKANRIRLDGDQEACTVAYSDPIPEPEGREDANGTE